MSDFERIFSIEKHRTIERNDYEYKIGNDLCFRKPSYIDESDPESPLAKKKKLAQEICEENAIYFPELLMKIADIKSQESREANEKSPSKSPKRKPKKIPTKFQQNKLESIQKES